jgi:predicted ArsR family transcriptional regulator
VDLSERILRLVPFEGEVFVDAVANELHLPHGTIWAHLRVLAHQGKVDLFLLPARARRGTGRIVVPSFYEGAVA